MKNFVFAALLAVSSYASATTITDFTGIFSADKFTKTINGGSINTNGAPTSISLTSANNGGGNKNQDFTIVSPENFTISFNYNFVTSDDGATFDPFGFLLNNVFTKIAFTGGNQSGSSTFEVAAGDKFGFRANSVDSVFGAATTVVSGFSAVNAVPEPTTVALLGLGLLGFAASRRKSAKNKNA